MITETIQFSDTEWLEDLQKGADLAEQLAENLDGLGDIGKEEFKQLTQIIGKYEDGLSDLSEKIKKTERESAKNAKTAKAQKRAYGQLTGELKGVIANYQVAGISIKDVSAGLKKSSKFLGASARALTGMNKALKLFKIALVSTGIGALLVALGSAIALFTKTQRGIDFVNRSLAAVGSVIDNVVERAAKLGDAFSFIIKGQFKKAFNEAKGAVSSFAAEVVAEAAAAAELERTAQRLRDQQRELSVEFEQSRAKIEQLKLITDDQTKSIRERTEAAKEAAEIEKGLFDRRVQLAEQNLKQIQARNALGESLTSDLENEAEAAKDLAAIQGESYRVQTELQNKLNSLNKEAAENAKRLREEYQSLAEELNDKFIAAQLKGLTATERVKEEFEIARAEVVKLKNELIALATSAEQVAEIETKFKVIIDQIDLEEVRELDNLQLPLDQLSPQKIPLKDVQIETDDQRNFENEFKQLGLKAGEGLGAGLSEGFDKETLTLEEKVARYQQLAEQINNVVGGIIDSLTATTEQQIERQNELIEATDDRINNLEDQLKEEQNLREDGLANNYDALKQQLELEFTERTAQEQRLIELQEKSTDQKRAQARIQAGIDTAIQLSNITTAISNIVKSGTQFGVAGIALVIAGVAAILGFWAKWKATAKQSVEVPKFKTGGQLKDGLVIGPSHDQGGINLLDAFGQMYNIQGGEFVTNDKVTEKRLPLLEAINDGQTEYRGINFDDLMTGAYESGTFQPDLFGLLGRPAPRPALTVEAKQIEQSVDSFRETKVQRQSADIENAFAKYLPELIAATKETTFAVKSKPVIIQTDDGYIREIDSGFGIHRTKYKNK